MDCEHAVYGLGKLGSIYESLSLQSMYFIHYDNDLCIS